MCCGGVGAGVRGDSLSSPENRKCSIYGWIPATYPSLFSFFVFSFRNERREEARAFIWVLRKLKNPFLRNTLTIFTDFDRNG